ncbi:MAG: 7-carboxy-7-deazaguanine synthase QueE [Heliobacteriaceae bacterium]|jgi:organic radical activating enzyme|nr:7-carboxy-7-deazaguanine synthase QueE [Heliobacteriaceae bacterium]
MTDKKVRNDETVKIKEIFTSIQGEGPYAGVKQLFIRFCNCNLKCNYCDTEFSSESDYEEFCPSSLAEKIKEFDLKTLHSISLTGGEPLLQADFLKKFLPQASKKIYLETNATLADKLLEVKPFIDIVSADIKLESASGVPNSIKFHEKFFQNCRGLETFAKIIFDENITDCEIESCAKLAGQFNLPLILQPKMNGDKMSITLDFAVEILDRFLAKYPNVRLIPQIHKFMGLR